MFEFPQIVGFWGLVQKDASRSVGGLLAGTAGSCILSTKHEERQRKVDKTTTGPSTCWSGQSVLQYP